MPVYCVIYQSYYVYDTVLFLECISISNIYSIFSNNLACTLTAHSSTVCLFIHVDFCFVFFLCYSCVGTHVFALNGIKKKPYLI